MVCCLKPRFYTRCIQNVNPRETKKWKTCKCSMIPYVWLRIRFNGSLHVAIGVNANRAVDDWCFTATFVHMIQHAVFWHATTIHIFTTRVVIVWIQVSRQAFPRLIGKKVRGVSKTHGYHNVAYACCIYGISALGVAWHLQPALHHRL